MRHQSALQRSPAVLAMKGATKTNFFLLEWNKNFFLLFLNLMWAFLLQQLVTVAVKARRYLADITL